MVNNTDRSLQAPQTERGLRSYTEGHEFEKQVAELYRLMGYSVEGRRGFAGREVDLFLTQRIGDLEVHRAIECKTGTVTAEHLDSFLAKLRLVRKNYPTSLGTIVSIAQFTPSVASHAASEGVTLTRFSDLEATLIDGTGYCRSIIQEIEANEIYRLDRFIEPQTALEGASPGPASEMLRQWLSQPDWNQLTLLGDVGTGKSFLTRYFAHQLAREYLSDPVTSPLPIRIDLREADRHLSLEGLILTHFASTSLRNTRFDVFQHVLSAGRIVLILDGFDEMAAKINPRITIRNFYELTRTVSGRAKVLLTCRTHYFKSRSHEEEVLLGEPRSATSPEARDLYWDIISRKGYRIAYLQPFSVREVELFVRKALGSSADSALGRIEKTYNLMELSQRPMLLEMIVRSIESLRDREISAATLYGVYTDAWVHRERWRELLDSSVKLDFLLALARILWNEELTSVHHTRLACQVESHFSSRIEADVIGFAELDAAIRTATFLTRDSAGNYGFAHKSYLEYFVARGVARDLEGGHIEQALRLRRLSPEVLMFLVELVRALPVGSGLETILRQPYQADVSENALLLLYQLRRLAAGTEEPIMLPESMQLQSSRLQQVLLPRAVIRAADLRDASLAEAVLSSCDLTSCNFGGANLQSVNLANSQASGAVFERARMDRVDLQKANCVGADFRNASLRSAVLSEAILTGAVFEESNTLGATFDGAVDGPSQPRAIVATGLASEEVLGEVRQYAFAYGSQYALDVDDLVSAVWQSLLEKGLATKERGLAVDSRGLQAEIDRVAHEEWGRRVERIAKRRAAQRFVDVEEYELVVWPDTEQRVLVNEVIDIMRDTLSDSALQMVKMRYLEDFTEREIAEKLGISASSVSRQIHRALAVVRSKLRPAP